MVLIPYNFVFLEDDLNTFTYVTDHLLTSLITRSGNPLKTEMVLAFSKLISGANNKS